MLLTLLLAGACKTTKRSPADLKEVEAGSAEAILNSLVTNQVSADWLGARARIRHEGDDFSFGFSSNIRLRKDSLIWMNVKKFGFEVARVLIRPDSIYVIDRFNKEFYAEDFSFIQETLNFPLNFEMVQNLVLGNPVFFTRRLLSEKNGSGYRLWSETGQPDAEYLVGADGMKLEKMAFREAASDRFLDMDLGEYTATPGAGKFSYFRKMNMDSPQTGKVHVEISFTDVELDVPQNMPFQIPSGYSRAD